MRCDQEPTQRRCLERRSGAKPGDLPLCEAHTSSSVPAMLPPALPPTLPTGALKPARSILAPFLSIVLVLFVGSAVISFLSDSLFFFFHRQDLAAIDALALLLILVMGFVTYGLMALFPGIPKRFFLPVSLFIPVAGITLLPLFVYFSKQAPLIVLGAALGQFLLGLFIVHRMQGGWKFCWPLFPQRLLADRKFSFGNLTSFVLAGVFLLLPALVFFGAWSAQLAVDHFTAGFVALRPSGLIMQVRKYVRDDGKKIMLVPMSHIGEPKFYRDLAASFPADSVVLMEGVTDNQKVAPAPLDYSRAAASVGAVEQKKAFRPQGEIVAADVDMSSFSPATLDLLKVAILVHSKGVTAETLPFLMKPTPPDLQEQLVGDLLTKRNQHLLGVLRERLPKSDQIIVPWGAAHMPEISREILKLGFRQVETQEYVAIRFGS